jgi:hypothetical protein
MTTTECAVVLDNLRRCIASEVLDEWLYASDTAMKYGCPHDNGYPCQGAGDFGRHDVVTHCPAACWVRVARNEEGAGDGN